MIDVNECMNECMNEWTIWIYACMNERMNETHEMKNYMKWHKMNRHAMNEYMQAWMCEWTRYKGWRTTIHFTTWLNETNDRLNWMTEWMNEWHEWMNESFNESINYLMKGRHEINWSISYAWYPSWMNQIILVQFPFSETSPNAFNRYNQPWLYMTWHDMT